MNQNLKFENLISNPSKAEFCSARKSLENDDELDDREIWILNNFEGSDWNE